MKPDDEIYTALIKVVNHPVVYGFGAGVVRFIIGDKTAGWKALITSIMISMFVALGAMVYLIDEPYTDGKKAFFTIIASFLARDLLVALLSIGSSFSHDPAGFVARIREAFRGSQK